MVNSVIGGFQKISKKREKSREELDLAHARKYKKPKRIDKRGKGAPFQIQDNHHTQEVQQEEYEYDYEY